MKTSYLLIVPFALACGGATDPGPTEAPPLLERLPRALTAAEQTTIGAVNRFAFDLLDKATAAEPGKNVFLSPLSVSMALGMVMNGARGETRDEMAATLGFGSTPQGEINDGYRSLIALLGSLDPKAQFTIANSIWTRRDYPVLPAFLADARQFFDAEARALDFGSPAALDTINGWVNQKTKGKIPTILSSIRPDEILFAVNAIYFKGLWRAQFKKSETQTGQFRRASGAPQSVPFMHREEDTPYFKHADFEMVELWYGAGAHAMTVILPSEGTTAASLAARLTADDFAAAALGLRKAKVDLFFPKITLEYKRSLGDDLQALGMRRAFSDLADLSGIADDRLQITRVEHKAFVAIDEEGTEASAATSVGVGVVSAPLTVAVRVDRPFLVAIRERLSGTILFLGLVSEIPAS
jgi:serine protease inhibitor